MDKKVADTTTQCPFHGAPKHASLSGRSNRDWWPNQLNLKILHQHSALSNPDTLFRHETSAPGTSAALQHA